jgi:NADH-ubiquinone oxidoreductase chain 6
LNQFFIDIIALSTLVSSLLVITSKNPVISVVFLISVFINAAGYLILTGVNFLGISYIVVYVGAITVLFLFVIMLLNINLEDILEIGSEYSKNIPLALFISFTFVYEFFNILPFIPVSLLSFLFNFITNINSGLYSTSLSNSLYGAAQEVQIAISPIIADTSIIHFTQIESLGYLLYTTGAILLIICSMVLLLSMVGPIFLHIKQN